MNPWAGAVDAPLGNRLGDPRSGLVLARKHGIDARTACCVDDCYSSKLIESLQDINELHKDLEEVELDIHRRLLDAESADVMHLDVLEARLHRMEALLSHFTDLLGSKDKVLTALQSKHTDNSLKIEAPYHRCTAELISSISPSLINLEADCNRLQWARGFQLSQTSLDKKLSSTVQSLVDCKCSYQQCLQLHQNMH